MKNEENNPKKSVKILAFSLAVLMVVTMQFVIPAYAATGNLYASGITAPGGQVWINDPSGGHLWVSDHLFGFCRLDDPNIDGIFTVNQNICSPNPLTGLIGPVSSGQPALGPLNADGTRYVYVPDNSGKSKGVYRLKINPDTQAITEAIIIAPTAGIGGNRPTATALGPDGILYVGFLKSGNIVRITNPSETTALQQVQQFGKTSDGKGISGLAFAGSDLYVAEGSAVTMIGTAGGTASLTPIEALSPTAIASQVDNLYVAETPGVDSSILRYNVTSNVIDLYATNVSGTTFKFASGLSLNDTGSLFIGDDPSDGAQVLQGHIYNIPAQAPEIAGAGTPPPTVAMAQGVLNASQITAPGGAVKLDNNLWVSDHLLGFCRLDPSGGLFAINQGTCFAGTTTVAISPGQPSFDGTYVYIPDNADKDSTSGVWRVTYDPVTQTVGNAVLLSDVGGNRVTASAIGPDGNLYVGFIKNGNIVRITNPNGAIGTQTVQTFGSTLDGRGVSGIAFAGTDLFIAEGTAVTKIGSGGGKAQNTPIVAAVPTAITSDGINTIFVADTPARNSNIIRYTINPNSQVVYANQGLLPDGTTTPFQFVSGLYLNMPSTDLYVGDDPTDGALALQGHIWTVANALQEYCHNPASKDIPCRGNRINR